MGASKGMTIVQFTIVKIEEYYDQNFKRITRSFFGAELFSIIHDFYYASTVRLAVNEITGNGILLVF